MAMKSRFTQLNNMRIEPSKLIVTDSEPFIHLFISISFRTHAHFVAFQNAAAICKKHNVLFVADEVQTGCGRTGKLLACDYDNVKPDILILGKALSGGTMPVSAVMASDEVCDVQYSTFHVLTFVQIMLTILPGQHGSTFGGSPLGARVAMTALEVLRDEGMIENSFKIGEKFRGLLNQIKSPLIKEIRGRGLMNAIVIKPTADGKVIDNRVQSVPSLTSCAQTAYDVCLALKDNGILCKPSHSHIIRLNPPLVINDEQIEECAEIFDRTITNFQ